RAFEGHAAGAPDDALRDNHQQWQRRTLIIQQVSGDDAAADQPNLDALTEARALANIAGLGHAQPPLFAGWRSQREVAIGVGDNGRRVGTVGRADARVADRFTGDGVDDAAVNGLGWGLGEER